MCHAPAATRKVAAAPRGRLTAARQYTSPVRVQLQASTGGCWESVFSAPSVSDAIEFRAKE